MSGEWCAQAAIFKSLPTLSLVAFNGGDAQRTCFMCEGSSHIAFHQKAKDFSDKTVTLKKLKPVNNNTN